MGDGAFTGRRPEARIAAALAVVGLVLAPPLFERTLAVAPLVAGERGPAWALSASFLLVAALVSLTRGATSRRLAALAFGVLLLVGVEFTVRAAVLAGAGDSERLARLGNRTHPEFFRIRGHPFLQYTGNAGANALGFFESSQPQRAKPPGVVRIVCLGGSTTAEGNWPGMLGARLQDQEAGRYEVLNFAMMGYSSAHVLVNFVLNALDHDPDYVVLHTGWNDTMFRRLRSSPRTDFDDVFLPFVPPAPVDRWLLRASVVYRWIADRIDPNPSWAQIAPALIADRAEDESFEDPRGLEVLRGNLEKMLDLAAARDIRMVLATIPHSSRADVPNAVEARHLGQTNEILRDLAAERGDAVLLVDLDRLMTGRYDAHFGDLAHLDPDGRAAKAAAVGDAILVDLRAQLISE